MSSKVCPNTCGQLWTAAVFISIGVVQLLAGVILLKSEYVYLLAGIDFLAAASNISVGIFLGIASSLWENKPKQMTGKNIARQNILAGLYISVMVVNATTAIIMIMGEGNKLLTIPENADRNNSAVFVLEIMACAYVTSVCSPIVCIVVALVCLSGNRIQIHENMKERENIAKTESYGWVFRDNHGTGPKKLSDIIQSPSNRSSPGSDDVFLERKCCMSKKSFLKKFSKKKNSRKSMSSLGELQSPLEIWDQKRKKILREITEPNKIFFSDDYLQFPEINCGSYVETILPRIRQTSLIHSKNGETSLSNKRPAKERTLHKSSHSHDEVDTNLSKKVHMSNNSNFGIKTLRSWETIQPAEEVTDSMRRYYSVQYKNEKCHKNSSDGNSSHKIAPSRYDAKSSSFSENRTKNSGLLNKFVREIPNAEQNSSHIQEITRRKAQNSIKSSVFAIKSEAIDELKSKFNEIHFDEAATIGDRKLFMKSFKNFNCNSKRSKFSELDLEHGSDLAQNSSANARSAEIRKTTLAGEVVPIAVRTQIINTANSIPVTSVTTRVLEWQPSSEDLSSSDCLKESLRKSSDGCRNKTDNINFPRRATSLYDKIDKCKQIKSLDFHSHKISSPSEPKNQQDNIKSCSIMTSIPESPEETIPDHTVGDHETLVPRKEKSGFKLSRAYTCKDNSALPKHNRLKSTQSTHFLKRLWSSAENGSKTDLSNLVMDRDSLIGLSDEELMDRTRRLRELRKSVVMRLKNEENNSKTTNAEKKSSSIEI